MCGRYTIFPDESHVTMKEIISEIESKYGLGAVSTGEIFPTNKVPILAEDKGGITPMVMAWGFPQYKGSGIIINARAETAAEKPTFSKALKARRCIVPTTGFYEWKQLEGQKKKAKYHFTLPNSSMVYLAGLFDQNNRFVILTINANEAMRPYHHRMPVILSENEINDWVCDNVHIFTYLNRIPPELSALRV